MNLAFGLVTLLYPSGLRGTGGLIRRPCARGAGVIFGPRAFSGGPDTRQTYRMTGSSADSAVDVFFLAIGMALLATLLWMAYKTLQHPRLPVNRPASSPPSDLVRRAALSAHPPLMVAFWMFVLLALLTAAARDRSGEQIVVATSAVIGGTATGSRARGDRPRTGEGGADRDPGFHPDRRRIHRDRRGDHNYRTDTRGPGPHVLFGLVMFDFVITALWFGSIRLAWRRRNSRVEGGFGGQLGGACVAPVATYRLHGSGGRSTTGRNRLIREDGPWCWGRAGPRPRQPLACGSAPQRGPRLAARRRTAVGLRYARWTGTTVYHGRSFSPLYRCPTDVQLTPMARRRGRAQPHPAARRRTAVGLPLRRWHPNAVTPRRECAPQAARDSTTNRSRR